MLSPQTMLPFTGNRAQRQVFHARVGGVSGSLNNDTNYVPPRSARMLSVTLIGAGGDGATGEGYDGVTFLGRGGKGGGMGGIITCFFRADLFPSYRLSIPQNNLFSNATRIMGMNFTGTTVQIASANSGGNATFISAGSNGSGDVSTVFHCVVMYNSITGSSRPMTQGGVGGDYPSGSGTGTTNPIYPLLITEAASNGQTLLHDSLGFLSTGGGGQAFSGGGRPGIGGVGSGGGGGSGQGAAGGSGGPGLAIIGWW